mgnify:CR=1 FL=1
MREAGYYHVYNRGCNRQPIFLDDDNYVFLLRKVKACLPLYDLTIIAYCLMPNHYHLLVHARQEDVLSPFLQRLFSGYVQAFNKQHGRSGTLFEGRARWVAVTSDPYVLQLCRYIHLNPVKAGLVGDPAAWPYSNYLDCAGLRSGTIRDDAFMHMFFTSPADYADFVMGALGDELGGAGLEAYMLD